MRLLLIFLAGCALEAQPFHCETDAECSDGRCEAEGACSFADPDCAGTGRRYGEHAPAALSQRCVAACVERLHAGGATSCAGLTSGVAVCWGNNGNGELGLGVADQESHARPSALPLPSPITRISFSNAHACALAGGQVYCWGRNAYGEVVSPASEPIYQPQKLRAASSVSAGGAFTCALTDGAPSCWGSNQDGRLGAGSAAPAAGPLAVVAGDGPIAGIARVAASAAYACAASASAAWCWGANGTGVLGDGTTEPRSLAVPVLLPAGRIVDLGAGEMAACAIVERDIVCWGANDLGQLNRPVEPFDATPTLVLGRPHDPVQLGAGAAHMCMREATGALWCWGGNGFGELGPPASGRRFSVIAVQPLGATAIVDLAAGLHHSCALTTDNRVLCWGDGGFGRLGGEKPTPDAVVEARIACGASAE